MDLSAVGCLPVASFAQFDGAVLYVRNVCLDPQIDRELALAGCGKIVLSDGFLPSLRRFVSFERFFAGIFRVIAATRMRFRAVRRHYDPGLTALEP
jgi:hypothetical protein